MSAPEKDTSGPAFPTRHRVKSPSGIFTTDLDGMTLRDAFALGALQGMLSTAKGGKLDKGKATTHAYGYADAMLEARKK